MTNLFDQYSRPLPRFYELTIERRAEAIMVERNAVHLRRATMGKRAFFFEVRALSHLDNSVALLDVVSVRRSNKLYQQILMGDGHA